MINDKLEKILKEEEKIQYLVPLFNSDSSKQYSLIEYLIPNLPRELEHIPEKVEEYKSKRKKLKKVFSYFGKASLKKTPVQFKRP